MEDGKKHSLTISIQRKCFHTDTGAHEVLRDIDLHVKHGEVLVLLGPSGCGKTTLLRIVAGLDTDYDGEIRLGDSVKTEPGPDRGIMFQDPRLLPWLSVLHNIGFGFARPRLRHLERESAERMIDLVGLAGFGSRWPSELSGGMAHRVALARALVNLPDVLLLDEPFGALDMKTRFRLQCELARILTSTATTALLVTHDIDEALYLGDRIAVMSTNPGRIMNVHPVSAPRARDRTNIDLLKLRAVLFREMMDD